jgi:cytochrome c oxidase subunit 4
MQKPPGSILGSWLALLLLLAATCALAYVPLGTMNIVVALAIGGAKGLIVVLVFMKLARGASLRWVFAGAGFFWLLIMFGLSMTDYASRQGWPSH